MHKQLNKSVLYKKVVIKVFLSFFVSNGLLIAFWSLLQRLDPVIKFLRQCLCFQYRLPDIEKMTVFVTSFWQVTVSFRVVTQTNVWVTESLSAVILFARAFLRSTHLNLPNEDGVRPMRCLGIN